MHACASFPFAPCHAAPRRLPHLPSADRAIFTDSRSDRPTRVARPASRPRAAVSPSVEELLRVARAARQLDVSTKRVRQLVEEGWLEAIRLGPRQLRVTASSLKDYIEQLRARGRELREDDFAGD